MKIYMNNFNWGLIKMRSIDRDIFVNIFREERFDIMDLFHEFHDDYCWNLYEFIMFKHDDEYYIVHPNSNTIINFYKALGRYNSFNRKLNVEELKAFISLLKSNVKDWLENNPNNYDWKHMEDNYTLY